MDFFSFCHSALFETKFTSISKKWRPFDAIFLYVILDLPLSFLTYSTMNLSHFCIGHLMLYLDMTKPFLSTLSYFISNVCYMHYLADVISLSHSGLLTVCVIWYINRQGWKWKNYLTSPNEMYHYNLSGWIFIKKWWVRIMSLFFASCFCPFSITSKWVLWS